MTDLPQSHPPCPTLQTWLRGFVDVHPTAPRPFTHDSDLRDVIHRLQDGAATTTRTEGDDR